MPPPIPGRPGERIDRRRGIWLASYMRWLPAFGVLKPAIRHPLRRDAVMFGAHLAWGWAAAEAMRELGRDRAAIFADGPARDAPA